MISTKSEITLSKIISSLKFMKGRLLKYQDLKLNINYVGVMSQFQKSHFNFQNFIYLLNYYLSKLN